VDIGIPRERAADERRVALTPAAVGRIVQAGHRVFVERSAGVGSRFSDEQYGNAGASLSYEAEEVFARADLLLKVQAPSEDEYAMLQEGKALMCFLQPAVAPPDGFRSLVERGVTSVAMELIEDRFGDAPIRHSMSEIAGPLSIQIAARLLESASGGRGILLGGAPGIPPAVVVILGAGVVGRTAAQAAVGNGAQVVVLDRRIERLRSLDEWLPLKVATLLADPHNVARAVRFADVLIGAVMVRGGRTPHLVTEAMVREMKPGAVVIDVSIDEGGCLETSRPTTAHDPTYVWENVLHYAVPNIPANVARTATYALTNACLEYVLSIADNGLDRACAEDAGLCRGVVTARGRCLHRLVAERFGVPFGDPEELFGGVGAPHDDR